jgi:hypothetical protein
MAPVDQSLIDPDAPEEVQKVITDSPREPVTDPRLGIHFDPPKDGVPKNRLVTIGDSITHGFQSGAIFNTDISFPSIVARELGWYPSFRYPLYAGFGGLPLNLEYLARDLEDHFGSKIDWWEAGSAAFRVRHVMAQVEDWWERGPGSLVPNDAALKHNLGIYGWDLRDVLHWTVERLRASMKAPTDHFLRQTVENANEIAAIRVLHSADGDLLTPLDAAIRLGQEGTDTDANGPGIETLVVLLGANNVLSTVTQLRVAWSGEGYDDPSKKGLYNVWRPSHFKKEFDLVADKVQQIGARHVIWGTVPHVTIAPIARGVGTKVQPGSRYFPYYTRPWISDRDFDVDRDPHITEVQARAIDSTIDAYNEHIVSVVAAARQDRKDWYVLETCGLLDRLASRRYIDDPKSRPDWWTRYELPPALQALHPVPDSRFFIADEDGRTQGGLFSLDGVHPTTIGYGIVAQEVIKILELAEVPFFREDGKTLRTSPVQVDFHRLIRRDTLISDPPRSVRSGLAVIGWLDEMLDIFGRILRK